MSADADARADSISDRVDRVPAADRADEQVLPKPARRRRSLLVVGIVMALLIAAGGVVAYLVYDHATAVDRTNPSVVVAQYIDALFGQRDHARADTFVCRDPRGRLDTIRAAEQDVIQREQRYQTRFSVSWQNVTQTSTKTDASQVSADLQLSATADGVPVSQTEHWLFETVHESGWRVCGARQVS